MESASPVWLCSGPSGEHSSNLIHANLLQWNHKRAEQNNFIFIILIFLGGHSKQGSSAVMKGITGMNWKFIVSMLKVRIVDN